MKPMAWSASQKDSETLGLAFSRGHVDAEVILGRGVQLYQIRIGLGTAEIQHRGGVGIALGVHGGQLADRQGRN